MLTLLLVSLCALSTPTAINQDGPPGLIFVKGGATKIGSTREQVEKLVLARAELAFALAGETPQFTRAVEDFLLMPTEVTNEQYAEFVRASGCRPPRSWGIRALQTGQVAFLEEQGKAKQAARGGGQPFEPAIFDPEAWWEENWKTILWEIPPGEDSLPVVFVTYAEAQRYARWAGLRLMTEFEYQRAARGDSARVYPWGDDWDDRRYCLSMHSGRDLPTPVSSFSAGAVGGVHDLAGNVWEWTSSPFQPFPGYEALRVTRGKRTIELLAPFDPNQRVTVSGSFHVDKVGVRVSTRMNADPGQTTNALGFRCAAYPQPGFDAANALIEQGLRLGAIGGAELAPRSAAVLRNWQTVPGTVKVPGYAVIQRYEHLLFCPRLDLPATTTEGLTDQSIEDGPVFIGFIDLPRPMASPELDAGTYWIAWRGAGALPQAESEKQGMKLVARGPQRATFHQVPGFDAGRSCYIFYSARGEPQLALAAPAPRVEKTRASRVVLEPFVPPDPKTWPKNAPPQVALDTVRFTAVVPSASSKAKALIFDLPIRVAPGTYDSSWK